MKLIAARWGWFACAFALFAGRDMCLGGGHPPDPEPPADAPSDAPPDGAVG